MSVATMRYHVIIPTVAKPVSVWGLEQVPYPATLVTRKHDPRTLAMAGAYGDFLGYAGPVGRFASTEFSSQKFHLELEHDIDHGRSWEFPVLLLHAVFESGLRIVGNADDADVVIWATGGIAAVRGQPVTSLRFVDPGSSYHLEDKVAASLTRLAALAEANKRLIVLLPAVHDVKEAVAAEAALRAALPSAALSVAICTTVGDAMALLPLPALLRGHPAGAAGAGFAPAQAAAGGPLPTSTVDEVLAPEGAVAASGSSFELVPAAPAQDRAVAVVPGTDLVPTNENPAEATKVSPTVPRRAWAVGLALAALSLAASAAIYQPGLFSPSDPAPSERSSPSETVAPGQPSPGLPGANAEVAALAVPPPPHPAPVPRPTQLVPASPSIEPPPAVVVDLPPTTTAADPTVPPETPPAAPEPTFAPTITEVRAGAGVSCKRLMFGVDGAGRQTTARAPGSRQFEMAASGLCVIELAVPAGTVVRGDDTLANAMLERVLAKSADGTDLYRFRIPTANGTETVEGRSFEVDLTGRDGTRETFTVLLRN